MSLRIAGFVLALSVVVGGQVCAQTGTSVRVEATVEPTKAEVGDAVVLTVRVEGVSPTVVRTPDRPAVVNLKPQQRRPTRQHVRGLRGEKLRRGVTFSWRFRARQPGTARIRPVTVAVRGEEYTTENIRLRVVSSSRRRSDPNLTYPDASSTGTPIDERDLFIRATATADRAYQNEQVVVEYRLFYRPSIRLRHSRLSDSWDAPGFWREELTVASRPTPQRRRVDGRRYETVVLKRVALFPTRPGTLRVDPLRIETEAQGTMRMRRGGPALRGRFRPVRLSSRGLSVRVRPLPAGAPPSFDGAVGHFSMTAHLDADSSTVGEAASLTVQIQGTGNLPTLSPPQLDLPSALEAYEPTIETRLRRKGRRIRGTKVFTYTLVPQSGGRHALPPVQFSYFDPETRRYETLRAGLPALQVSGASSTPSRELSGRTGEGLPVGDVTGLMTASEARWVRTDQPPLYRQTWVYLALLLPVLLAGGGLLYRRRQRGRDPTSNGKADTALDAAQVHLRTARRHLDEGADAAVWDAVERALRTFLAERLGHAGRNSTRSALDRRLARHDVPESLRNRLYTLLDRCDEAQFAPGVPSGTAPDTVLAEARTLLKRLREHVPAPEDSSEFS